MNRWAWLKGLVVLTAVGGFPVMVRGQETKSASQNPSEPRALARADPQNPSFGTHSKATGQEFREEPSAPQSRESFSDDDLYVRDEPPTARQMLEALRRSRPTGRIVLPRSAEGGKAAATPRLLPEGSIIVDRTGALKNSGAWWTLDWVDDDPPEPVRVLFNSTLEQMIQSARSNERLFVVSGELTLFERQNYVLITVARLAPGSTVMPSGTSAEPSIQPLTPGATSDDVLEAMQRAEPVRGERTEDASANGFALAPILEGTPLIRRPGRVMQSGDWWTLVFESDKPDFPEPPMKVLPCQSLELMLHADKFSPAGDIFAVSGDITAFRGENYLLPRVVTRRMEMGNFRK